MQGIQSLAYVSTHLLLPSVSKGGTNRQKLDKIESNFACGPRVCFFLRKRDAARSEKVKAILDYGDDILARDLGRTDEQKARVSGVVFVIVQPAAVGKRTVRVPPRRVLFSFPGACLRLENMTPGD